MNLKAFKSLLSKYNGDEKLLLKEEPGLENLYAFSNQREGIVEWYPFEYGAKVLLVGAGEGALAGIWLRKNCELDVLESDKFEAEKLLARYEGSMDKIHMIYDVKDIASEYDYAVSIGTFHMLSDEDLIRIFASLKDDGKLFIACDNKYGAKWWAGTKPSECVYSNNELKARISVLSDAEEILWYYPMEDYLLPVSIYSDDYLPEGRELERVIPAYNDNEYQTTDVGKKYAEICRDGRFAEYANSFLLTVSKKKTGERIVYCKYNRLRLDEFKTRTLIVQNEDGERYVEKSALFEAGKKHIASLISKYGTLVKEGRNIGYAEPQLINDGWTVRYEYVSGGTLADRIAEKVTDGSDLYREIEEGLKTVIGSLPVHNIDSIFSNYIVGRRELGKKRNLIGIDCEWISEEEQDKDFITYRVLSDFYDSNYAIIGDKKEIFLKHFGIDQDAANEFWKREQEFQKSIHGDVQAVYLDNYRKQVKTFEQLESDARDSWMIDGFKLQLKNKDVEIKRMTEEKRLTDNHVHNLEAIIADLRHENGEMAKLIDYLNRHESAIFKARRKAGDKINEMYPKGSEARKNLEYTKMSILHPAQYAKLKGTKEGRNLIEGDYKIGSIYRENGKVRFKICSEPKVSIIIPCYNQVDYTYRCLLSIRKYTEDVDYEVIVADDVSTDATKELEKFVEGANIIHAKQNQGFLGNCNDAANQARGKYIMFLNNDTEVTEHWLSSLVELLEKDSSIGMTGSKLVFPDGKLQEAGGIIWKDGSGWNYGRGDDPDKFDYNYIKDVDFISGAAILIRHSLWNSIGGFDKRYTPAYCEDCDLAFEVRKAGFRVVYQPLSKVIHYEGLSNGTDVNGTGLKRYQVENFKKLKEKWAVEFENQYENDGRPNVFRARERSRGKKIVLMVDHYVPTYDKDTGSKCTWQYIQMFISKGYEVKFLGDSYRKDEPYTTELEQMGVEVIYGEYMKAEIWKWIDEHADDIYLSYLNRPHITAKYIDYFKDRGIRCLFFGSDLHCLRIEREAKLTGDPKKFEEAEYWRSVEFGIMHKADMSYYPSYVETDIIHEIDPSVKAKPIKLYVFEEFAEAEEKDFAKREGIIFVGGFAHPPNKDGLLWFVKEIWPKVHEATGADFYVVGSHADEEVQAVHDPDKGIIFKGFVSEEELHELYQKSRVCAVPLRYGAGVKGKVIESMYFGVPVLTTNIGAEGIEDAETVMEIRDSAQEWINELIALYTDTDRCSEMSRKSLAYVKERHSLEAAWKVIEPDVEG